MKIKYKILLILSLFICITVPIIFYASKTSLTALETSIGENSEVIAQEIIDSIDRTIYDRMERWQSFVSNREFLVDDLEISNQEFEQIEDKESHIESEDEKWRNSKNIQENKLTSSILNNSLSQELRSRIDFYNEKYEEDIFPEIFVTNKYGVVVGSSNQTSDYYQADETWWVETKENGFYVENLAYDESTDTYSLAICLNITDDSNNFLGELKIIYNVEDFLENINNIRQQQISHNDELDNKIDINIINNEGKVVFSTSNKYDFLDVYPKDIFENIVNDRGYFLYGKGTEQNLYSYARSNGYKDFEGFNWIAEINQPTNLIFKPIYGIRNNLIIIAILGTLVLLVIMWYLIKSITTPLEDLSKKTDQISNGNYNIKLTSSANDETGNLAKSFNKMVDAIRVSRQEVDRKVQRQTEDIEVSKNKLENQQKAILNILEDVNEEKIKTEQERNKIQAILSSIGDAVFVIDLDEKILMFNSIAEKLSGYTSDEAIGKPYKNILKFILEKDNSINEKFVLDAINSGKISYMTNHTLLINKHGKKIPVADSASPLKNKNGKIIGCVVVFHDVTKERQLAKMKDEFLNIAAHDLRTPMTAIKGYVDMMLNGDFGKLPKELEDPLKETQGSSERLIRLVNDFLTSSRIERGKITIQPKEIDIVPILQSLTNQIKPIAEKKGLQFNVSNIPEKMIVFTDPDKIQQVITNLLDNAIKYTREGSVSFDIEQHNNEVIFSIIDTGKGVSEEKQENLFTKYYQVSGGRDKVVEGQGTGLGLGLYISRLIVEGSGGKIWVESREGHGSKFSFSLPLIKNK